MTRLPEASELICLLCKKDATKAARRSDNLSRRAYPSNLYFEMTPSPIPVYVHYYCLGRFWTGTQKWVRDNRRHIWDDFASSLPAVCSFCQGPVESPDLRSLVLGGTYDQNEWVLECNSCYDSGLRYDIQARGQTS